MKSISIFASIFALSFLAWVPSLVVSCYMSAHHTDYVGLPISFCVAFISFVLSSATGLISLAALLLIGIVRGCRD
jgi:hypothetical protein